MALPLAEHLRQLVPYVPGKPIDEARREFGLKRVIKLASNENPLGASPRAVRAMRAAVTDLHRYPDGAAFHLKQALVRSLSRGKANTAAVEARNLVVGNGSNEIIDFLVRAYCRPGDKIACPKYSFVAYAVCAQAQDVRTVNTPVSEETFLPDLDALLAEVKRDPGIKLVFLANPNNPTGVWLDRARLRSFLSEVKRARGDSLLVVLDYAYWEYVTVKDLPDPVGLFREFSDLVVVLRTFSKIHGIAGLRAGYAIASPEVVSTLDRIRMPFNLNSPALAGAAAALEDHAFVKRSLKLNAEGMKFWEKALDGRGIRRLPSQGNFLLIETRSKSGLSGVEVADRTLRQGVILRPVANYGLHDWLRISVGTMAENRVALRALDVALGIVPARAVKAAAGKRAKGGRSK